MKTRVRKTNQLPLSSPDHSFRGLLFPLCCWETMELFKWSLHWMCLLPLLQAKTISSSAKSHTSSRGSLLELPASTLAEFNSTIPPPWSHQMLLAMEEEVPGQFKNQPGHRGKGAGARSTATNWKTAMLVLSPFAFILGLIILTLNVRYNKKKKLSALKSYPESCSTAGLQEQSPLTVTAGSWQRSIPDSRSPSLQHGEILIEWKDGTVTPLFDNANF
ncbi:unnamed protein product [Natator depressus]|uniref:uncharacterized protein LOC141987170 n=1 Tax=Natator depressus TaxID=27790 RepID=UPI003D4B3311